MMVVKRIVMGEGASSQRGLFREADPSSLHVVATPNCPLPQRGEGTRSAIGYITPWPFFTCRRMLGEVTWSEIGKFQISALPCAS